MEMNGDRVIARSPVPIPMQIARIIPIITLHPLISIHLHICGLMK